MFFYLFFFPKNIHQQNTANAIKKYVGLWLSVANGSENSIPSYFIKSFSISVPAHPYKYWLTYNMIFVQTPVTAVFRVMLSPIIQ
jgi:hypothetical protein